MRTTVRSLPPPSAAGGSGADLLAAAHGIGERLVREAVWYRGQCNWIGAEAGATAHRALGPALGDGTAGIALFLAELHAAAAAQTVGETARAAIAQALAHADDVPAVVARGLYAGRPGIAYAAARCAVLLDDERLLRRARRAIGALPHAAPADLAGGAAGAITGLLALARPFDDQRLVAQATRLGDELTAAARHGRAGWSWPAADAPPAEHGRCGLAHGAAGAAWALLELFAATGDARHRDAAEHALDYERHWFDEVRGDWPDLRGIERREPRGAFGPPYATGWRHGAAGIALSRMRAWRILGDERLRDEAITALTTTAAHTDRALLASRGSFTLGDGLAGNADVLLLGADLRPDGAALARRVGDVGIGRYATSLDGWPCGGGRTPALLTGDAGIGLFLLRLRDGAVPSVLWPGALPA
ncbi:MAG: lanthionine synthetase LanC family protein [Solirubrobacteraceae bacterium]|nr:lanthionine synthetase LanC family protein [Solirubrobacteraceae bacterium]